MPVKERIPNDSHPFAITHSDSHPFAPTRSDSHPNNRIEANEADTDTDTDTDTETEIEIEIETDMNIASPSVTDNSIHYDLEAVKMVAQAIDEETGGEYPYDENFVEYFYQVNEGKGWIGSNGEPVNNIVEWYKGFHDAVLSNGWTLSSARFH